MHFPSKEWVSCPLQSLLRLARVIAMEDILLTDHLTEQNVTKL